ncbi:hypothetical protein Ancab_005587 [Ancistrocladus abbreviatus]
MAAEEVNRPPPLPSYAEMIYSALDALNEKNGSNKTSISKYIESKYGNLPSSHASLLRHHLTRMRDTGELIFWKNNYMKPNPNFIRRGRGRPPKPRVPGAPPGPMRPRGRPRKDSDSHHSRPPPPPPLPLRVAAVPPKKQQVTTSQSGRPRGRPRKTPRPNDDGSGPAPAATAPAPVMTGSGRPRGRPPKVKSQTMSGITDFGLNE